MNSIQRLMSCFVIGLILMTYSCSKNNNDDPGGCNYLTEVTGEIEALTDAATIYGNDPTSANCQAYINAYQNYLNELGAHINCAALFGNQAELQTAINDAQAQLDDIQC